MKIGEFLFGMLFGLIIVLFLAYGFEQEDKLVEKHCQGLSGYEYGQCVANIY